MQPDSGAAFLNQVIEFLMVLLYENVYLIIDVIG